MIYPWTLEVHHPDGYRLAMVIFEEHTSSIKKKVLRV